VLRRLVMERASKFDLTTTHDNNTEDPEQQLVLTHRGQTIDEVLRQKILNGPKIAVVSQK